MPSLLLTLALAAAVAVAAASSASSCASTGQGYACHAADAGFNLNPPLSAPMPDPLLAGNATALWLRAANSSSCSAWWPKVADFLLMRLMQNRFLSAAIPGCGHTLTATPAGADAIILSTIAAEMGSLAIAVTPAVRGADAAAVAALVRSGSAGAAKLGAVLAADATRHGYSGFVLDLNLSELTAQPQDDAALGALLKALERAIQPKQGTPRPAAEARRTLGVTIPAARSSSALALELKGSSVIVYVSGGATEAAEYSTFAAAVELATAQFSSQGVALSIGLSLSRSKWWGGTGLPSIVDVQVKNTSGSLM